MDFGDFLDQVFVGAGKVADRYLDFKKVENEQDALHYLANTNRTGQTGVSPPVPVASLDRNTMILLAGGAALALILLK